MRPLDDGRVAERRFRAMGTECHIVVVGGPPGLADDARSAVAELERKWSRFQPDSELSRLNRLAGRPVVVSDDTFAAVARAVDGWWATNGRYDPTVIHALESLGYDRTFRSIVPSEGDVAVLDRTPGCAGIRLLPAARAVMLPPGVRLDLGGIGKGLAADLIVDRVLAAGADGVSVNLGGDCRLEGEPPTDNGWVVAIEQPFQAGLELTRVRLGGGAVVTTSPLQRRWRHGGADVHHLIDPRTGWPADSDVASVTVVGSEAAGAEIAAKAVFLAGVDEGLWFVERAGLAALVVGVHGGLRMTASLEDYLE